MRSGAEAERGEARNEARGVREKREKRASGGEGERQRRGGRRAAQQSRRCAVRSGRERVRSGGKCSGEQPSTILTFNNLPKLIMN